MHIGGAFSNNFPTSRHFVNWCYLNIYEHQRAICVRTTYEVIIDIRNSRAENFAKLLHTHHKIKFLSCVCMFTFTLMFGNKSLDGFRYAFHYNLEQLGSWWIIEIRRRWNQRELRYFLGKCKSLKPAGSHLWKAKQVVTGNSSWWTSDRGSSRYSKTHECNGLLYHIWNGMRLENFSGSPVARWLAGSMARWKK